jgi:hypothetical protein
MSISTGTFTDRDVHPPNAPVTEGPWAAHPVDRCFVDLIQYLDCCLSEHDDGRNACEHITRNLSRRFKIHSVQLDVNTKHLFQHVRRVLLGKYFDNENTRRESGSWCAATAAAGGGGGGGREPTISKHDLFRFYEFSLPSPTTKLPFITQIEGKDYSWFIPDRAGMVYTSALTLDAGMRRRVFLLAYGGGKEDATTTGGVGGFEYRFGGAGAGAGAGIGGGNEGGENATMRRHCQWLDETEKLVGYVRGIRNDPINKGLTMSDRLEFFKKIKEYIRDVVINQHNEQPQQPQQPQPSSVSVASSDYDDHDPVVDLMTKRSTPLFTPTPTPTTTQTQTPSLSPSPPPPPSASSASSASSSYPYKHPYHDQYYNYTNNFPGPPLR